MGMDDIEKGDEMDEDNEAEKRKKEEEELKKQKERQAMLDNLYVLICMIIIVALAVVIVVVKIQIFPDERNITFIPLPQQVMQIYSIQYGVHNIKKNTSVIIWYTTSK